MWTPFPYRHDAPETVFPPLFTLLDSLLEASLPSRVIAIELKQGEDREIWRGKLHDARLREGADFYLSVRSAMPNHELQTRFPQLCKAGSHDDVSEVVNIALSGMVIKPLSHVPAAIPLRRKISISRWICPPMLLVPCWKPGTVPSIRRAPSVR